MAFVLGRVRVIRRLYAWTRAWSGRPSATWALLVIACADSIFFPVPSEVLLLALYGTRPRRALWYATVAAAGTVLGAVIGYGIGYGLQEPTLWILGMLAEDRTTEVGEWLHDNVFWAVFVGSFTPFSDKLLVFSSGFFGVPFWTFLLAYTMGRVVRTYPGALLFHIYGGWIQRRVEKYIEIVSVGFLVVILLALLGLFFLPGLR